MNIAFWILQILLALHTLTGAVWKFSNSPEQTMPSLKAIPGGVWMGLSVVEILVAVCLIAPAFYKPLAFLIPAAALFIVVEMLLFCFLHVRSGDTTVGPLVYWLVVAALGGLLAWGRLTMKPL